MVCTPWTAHRAARSDTEARGGTVTCPSLPPEKCNLLLEASSFWFQSLWAFLCIIPYSWYNFQDCTVWCNTVHSYFFPLKYNEEHQYERYNRTLLCLKKKNCVYFKAKDRPVAELGWNQEPKTQSRSLAWVAATNYLKTESRNQKNLKLRCW